MDDVEENYDVEKNGILRRDYYYPAILRAVQNAFAEDQEGEKDDEDDEEHASSQIQTVETGGMVEDTPKRQDGEILHDAMQLLEQALAAVKPVLQQSSTVAPKEVKRMLRKSLHAAGSNLLCAIVDESTWWLGGSHYKAASRLDESQDRLGLPLKQAKLLTRAVHRNLSHAVSSDTGVVHL